MLLIELIKNFVWLIEYNERIKSTEKQKQQQQEIAFHILVLQNRR